MISPIYFPVIPVIPVVGPEHKFEI